MFDDTLKSVLALGEKTTLDGALHREGCRARKLSDAARRTSCGSGYAQDCQRRSKAATLTSTLAARQRVSGWKEGMAGGGWGGSDGGFFWGGGGGGGGGASDADTNRCIPRDSRGMSSTTSACAGAAANGWMQTLRGSNSLYNSSQRKTALSV